MASENGAALVNGAAQQRDASSQAEQLAKVSSDHEALLLVRQPCFQRSRPKSSWMHSAPQSVSACMPWRPAMHTVQVPAPTVSLSAHGL